MNFTRLWRMRNCKRLSPVNRTAAFFQEEESVFGNKILATAFASLTNTIMEFFCLGVHYAVLFVHFRSNEAQKRLLSSLTSIERTLNSFHYSHRAVVNSFTDPRYKSYFDSLGRGNFCCFPLLPARVEFGVPRVRFSWRTGSSNMQAKVNYYQMTLDS